MKVKDGLSGAEEVRSYVYNYRVERLAKEPIYDASLGLI